MSKKQSPIDLHFEFPKILSDTDKFKGTYENLKSKRVEWRDTTLKVDVQNPNYQDPKNHFTSHYPKDTWSAASKYITDELYFHHMSEHTIEGKQFDFEMHITHRNKEEQKSDIKLAYLAILFDQRDYHPDVTEE